MIELSKMPKLGFGLMRLPLKGEEIDHAQLCKMVDAYMQGNRLRESPVFNDGQGIGKRPSTTLTFASKGIFDGSISPEHLHT